MQSNLVSIITPSYNCAQFVEETIRSVQAQTYSNWEVAFVVGDIMVSAPYSFSITEIYL